MFAIVGLRTMPLEYGIQTSVVWPLLLLLLLACEPLMCYLSVRYPSWYDLRAALVSFGTSLESPFAHFRSTMAGVHFHHHPKPLDHRR